MAVVHRILGDLHARIGQALTVEAKIEAAQRYVAECHNVVLAMASAGDDRQLIPVDLWPHGPPPYPHTSVTTEVFVKLMFAACCDVDLLTRRRLLVNRHYYILLAHLLACPFPELIEHARNLPLP
jgi:hypothetical protein